MYSKPLNLQTWTTLSLSLSSCLGANKSFTRDAEYFPSKWYTFTSHYHVKLFSIKCKPWNWVCMSTARTAKHLPENPSHIWRACYSLSVPRLCAHRPTPLVFCCCECQGWCSFRVSMPQSPVGGTVTMCLLISPCSGWVELLQSPLYLCSLRSFHCWEKITVFADDNAIN